MSSEKLSQVGWLAAASAVVCAFTFKFPLWTGTPSSRQWPIFISVGLMAIWMLVYRREGVRTATLIASCLGMGVGIFIAKLLRSAELDKPLSAASLTMSVVMIVPLAGLLYFALRQERVFREKTDALDREYEGIKNLPPEQAAAAFEARFTQLMKEVENAQPAIERKLRLAAWLIALAMAFVAGTWVFGLRPRPTLLSGLLDASIFVLGIGFFVSQARWRRAATPEAAKDDNEDGSSSSAD